MAADDIPPWGTPDGSSGSGSDGGRAPNGPAPNGRVPDYGTPPPPPKRYGRPSSGGGTPPSPEPPAPSAVPDLLTADTIVVVERRGFLAIGGYDLITPGDVALGSLIREASAAGSFFGGAASTTFRLLDLRGVLVGTMQRPGTLGRSRFVVTEPGDAQIGTVEQENGFGAPQFLLTPARGRQLRLIGGKFGSREWKLARADDDSLIVGRVSQQYAGPSGMINNTHRFAVQLAPELTGDHRLLAVMATISLDYVRDAKQG